MGFTRRRSISGRSSCWRVPRDCSAMVPVRSGLGVTRNARRRNCMSKSGDRRCSWSGSKKKLSESVEARRSQVDWSEENLSVRQQCELLGLNRSTVYYTPAEETEENLCLMRRIDEQYLKTPFYG